MRPKKLKKEFNNCSHQWRTARPVTQFNEKGKLIKYRLEVCSKCEATRKIYL